MAPGRFEVIVVGLGSHGSAAAYNLAKWGTRVLGLDRWEPGHGHGSHHGRTRITRQAYAEGAACGAPRGDCACSGAAGRPARPSPPFRSNPLPPSQTSQTSQTS